MIRCSLRWIFDLTWNRGTTGRVDAQLRQSDRNMKSDYVATRQVAEKELREVLARTEALLAALGDEAGPAVEELRERLTVTIADVRKQLGSSFLANARETLSKARDTATSVDDFVQRRPWTSVAIGAGVGLLAGLLLRSD
jgi:ElaB/YqjD/DUF883 family membrane-anchored ribosome-binding protein